MNETSGPAPLSGDDWDKLLRVAERFEEAWKGSESVDLARFLPPPGTPLRLAVLQELIKTELEIRWRRGNRAVLEDYAARFLELGPVRALPARLIYEEYRTRTLYGDRPRLAAYRERFPQRFAELRQLLHEQPLPGTALGAGPPALRAGPPALGAVLPALGAGLPTPPPAAGAGLPTPPADAPDADEVTPPAEGYRLVERIGAGQYGEVYRARAPGGLEVAVKRIYRSLDGESGRRELQALELIRTLRHPFLLLTHRYWALKDRVVTVMELADDSVADWFRACRAAGLPGIPAAELVAYLREAAEALDYMHAKDVLHRDVKPGNLLRLSGHAKVADFGLARLQESSLMTATFCGTPLYMAPEVWQGKVSARSDQYALAMTYFEMRTGRRAFSGTDPYELGMQHLREVPDLTGAGGRESRVLLKALSKDPGQRYPTCRDFVEALAAATKPLPPAPEKFPWALTLVSLGLLLLAGLGTAVFLRQRGEREAPAATSPAPPNPPPAGPKP